MHLLELHKSRILSFQESLSRRDCCKCPLHKSLKRKRSGPSHKYPFSSLNLVFILHQAVSKTVKVHYVSQNWAEAAVFMRNIDTFGCILEIRLQLPFIRRHKCKWPCRNLTMGFCGSKERDIKESHPLITLPCCHGFRGTNVRKIARRRLNTHISTCFLGHKEMIFWEHLLFLFTVINQCIKPIISVKTKYCFGINHASEEKPSGVLSQELVMWLKRDFFILFFLQRSLKRDDCECGHKACDYVDVQLSRKWLASGGDAFTLIIRGKWGVFVVGF